jgi:phage terminase large subunit GpA-like protein
MEYQTSYQDYLQTPYWKEVSRAVKKRFGWRCGVCNSPQNLEAHHRTYEHKGSEMDHLDDLICLCKICHQIFHDGKERERKKRLRSIKDNLYRARAARNKELCGKKTTTSKKKRR